MLSRTVCRCSFFLFGLFLSAFSVLPAFAQEAVQSVAQVPSGAPQQPGIMETFSKMMPAFLLAFVIFHFMVIKPQQNKIKAQEALLNALKKGDSVVTSGGLIGRVAALEKDYILLEMGGAAKIKVERAHIVKKYEMAVEPSQAVAS